MNHVRLESVKRVSQLHKKMHNKCFKRAHYATIIATERWDEDFKILYTGLTIHNDFCATKLPYCLY